MPARAACIPYRRLPPVGMVNINRPLSCVSPALRVGVSVSKVSCGLGNRPAVTSLACASPLRADASAGPDGGPRRIAARRRWSLACRRRAVVPSSGLDLASAPKRLGSSGARQIRRRGSRRLNVLGLDAAGFLSVSAVFSTALNIPGASPSVSSGAVQPANSRLLHKVVQRHGPRVRRGLMHRDHAGRSMERSGRILVGRAILSRSIFRRPGPGAAIRQTPFNRDAAEAVRTHRVCDKHCLIITTISWQKRQKSLHYWQGLADRVIRNRGRVARNRDVPPPIAVRNGTRGIVLARLLPTRRSRRQMWQRSCRARCPTFFSSTAVSNGT